MATENQALLYLQRQRAQAAAVHRQQRFPQAEAHLLVEDMAGGVAVVPGAAVAGDERL